MRHILCFYASDPYGVNSTFADISVILMNFDFSVLTHFREFIIPEYDVY